MKKQLIFLLLFLTTGLTSCKKDKNVICRWFIETENLETNAGELTIESSISDVYDYDYNYEQILNMAIREASISLKSESFSAGDGVDITIKTNRGIEFNTLQIIENTSREIYINCDNREYRHFIHDAVDHLLQLGDIKLSIFVENRDNPQKIPVDIYFSNKIYICVRN